jgi:putative glutathione S-transferase
MGRLENGVWVYDDGVPNLAAKEDKFDKVITRDGSSGHPAVAGRYHLYVCLSCPFAHRPLIIRKLKHLEDVISVSIVDPRKGDEGWEFSDYPGSVTDTVCGFKNLREHYLHTKPDFTGRVVVPAMWDKETGEVLNNSSEQMVIMLNNEFDGPVDYYPPHLRDKIDEMNKINLDKVIYGVYKCGFFKTQEAYDAAIYPLFQRLDELEEILSHSRYLLGNELTIADIWLFPTLIRFDTVYHYHFKCNIRRIEDYPNLSNYVRDIYQIPGLADDINFDHYKMTYFWSHSFLNPFRIIPCGPANLEYNRPHDRDRFTN